MHVNILETEREQLLLRFPRLAHLDLQVNNTRRVQIKTTDKAARAEQVPEPEVAWDRQESWMVWWPAVALQPGLAGPRWTWSTAPLAKRNGGGAPPVCAMADLLQVGQGHACGLQDMMYCRDRLRREAVRRHLWRNSLLGGDGLLEAMNFGIRLCLCSLCLGECLLRNFQVVLALPMIFLSKVEGSGGQPVLSHRLVQEKSLWFSGSHFCLEECEMLLHSGTQGNKTLGRSLLKVFLNSLHLLLEARIGESCQGS